MNPLAFENAFYIKLGKKGGWEKSSITEGKLRIGWTQVPLSDIVESNWRKVKKSIKDKSNDQGAAVRDFNALRRIADSTPQDVWITFHGSYLWWCHVGSEGITEDEISKYRKALGTWSNLDTRGNPLVINQIPGAIAMLQGFRGTICKVKEVAALHRLLNNEPSSTCLAIDSAAKSLVRELTPGIKQLHWKDFETLVDLIFRGAGWRRVTTLGQTMKYSDLELEEPITRDLYQVQVKSTATVAEFQEYGKNFVGRTFRRLYFVVHSPAGDLSKCEVPENVELILPERLAELVLEFGLVNWLKSKVK